jgi:hypothetical protein
MVVGAILPEGVGSKPALTAEDANPNLTTEAQRTQRKVQAQKSANTKVTKEKQERSTKEQEISRVTAAGVSGIEQTGSA